MDSITVGFTKGSMTEIRCPNATFGKGQEKNLADIIIPVSLCLAFGSQYIFPSRD